MTLQNVWHVLLVSKLYIIIYGMLSPICELHKHKDHVEFACPGTPGTLPSEGHVLSISWLILPNFSLRLAPHLKFPISINGITVISETWDPSQSCILLFPFSLLSLYLISQQFGGNFFKAILNLHVSISFPPTLLSLDPHTWPPCFPSLLLLIYFVEFSKQSSRKLIISLHFPLHEFNSGFPLATDEKPSTQSQKISITWLPISWGK